MEAISLIKKIQCRIRGHQWSFKTGTIDKIASFHSARSANWIENTDLYVTDPGGPDFVIAGILCEHCAKTRKTTAEDYNEAREAWKKNKRPLSYEAQFGTVKLHSTMYWRFRKEEEEEKLSP